MVVFVLALLYAVCSRMVWFVCGRPAYFWFVSLQLFAVPHHVSFFDAFEVVIPKPKPVPVQFVAFGDAVVHGVLSWICPLGFVDCVIW